MLNTKAIGLFKAQSKLWLGEIYTAIRVIIIGIILAGLGIAGWASAEQGEVVSPIEVMVSPENVFSPLIATMVKQSFPDVTVCDDEGKCYTLAFDQ